MRALVWLLVAAFLILVGAYPALAIAVGSLLLGVLGLALHGAALLLAQPAVQILLATAGLVWAYRNRRIA